MKIPCAWFTNDNDEKNIIISKRKKREKKCQVTCKCIKQANIPIFFFTYPKTNTHKKKTTERTEEKKKFAVKANF